MVIGAGFILQGIANLLDTPLLYGGLMERLQATGASFEFYQRWVLEPYVELHEEAMVILASVLEILIGLQFMLGGLVSLAAVAGAFLVTNYALATCARSGENFVLYISLAAALLLVGRFGGGLTWGIDSALIRRLPDWVVLFPLRRTIPN